MFLSLYFYCDLTFLIPNAPSPHYGMLDSLNIPRCLVFQIACTYDYNLINQFIFEILTCSVITILLIIRSLNTLANSIKFVQFSFDFKKNPKNHVSFELTPVEMLLFSSLILDYIDLVILHLIYMNDIQIFTLNHAYLRRNTQLVTLILDIASRISLILANDVEINPGDFCSSFFSFCNWNVNSLAKDNFQRVQLLEAHNSLFNYDLISLCEVSLNNTVEIPDPLLESYTFISKNNPAKTRHGGVGLFYKNSLPLLVRTDLGFHESLVIELNFGRKKIFFTVLYRSPSHSHGSPEFETFLHNFQDLYTKIKSENPYSMFFTGDFNGHSQLWWPGG